jgi:eukaryotic-like serine/threonine-protein kinase
MPQRPTIQQSLSMVTSASREVLGQYTLYERLGRGGMATVDRAEMRGLAGFRKPVALKRLHPHVAADPAMVQSFVHEARLASHLSHPNIAQTYDLGREGDSYFIAMEYVPGPTLSQLLRQSAAAGVTVPVPVALAILSQICDALDYAHNVCDDSGKPLGIIHRDVSPSNVIISSTGVVKLIDFGVARAAGFGKDEAGLIKGKLSYMAPEYLEGQLDPRADLFGLGVIAHELLTGRPLFRARSESDALTQLRELPIHPPSRWNPDVPEDLDDIVLTALQRAPELRWQSAAAMRTAITNVMRSFGTPVTKQHLIEWVEWLGAPPRLATGSGIGLACEPEDDSGSFSEPLASSVGTEAPTRPITKREVKAVLRPAERGARRAWLLLLLMLALAAAGRDQLEITGRQLYAWYAG